MTGTHQNGGSGLRSVEIDRDEAMLLLAAAPFGRVVFTRSALPAIQPVPHVVDGGQIIIRTRLTARLTSAVRTAPDVVVAYQADQIDPARHTGWSVVVTGRARPLADSERVARYEQLLRPWVGAFANTVVSIEPSIVTGIRLVETRLEA
ncbi:pyridoxamine 5'-phosphate oxidase family protein [Nocardia transvalensis]|uniref:pyridoxamine 5'-phosphate oxidase family protein n=1 Tax=Nocardia transvalensis TaxID=37333 RepID=UPI001895A6FC|nr:pyridoxamine 5'-phosphate oxidase family protein [Nocardia transvalensis]MBF6331997.1 pyridoxamine 5'-phosphate oxidase family protein [Nocardia transvalensis]